jgi:hypothetical protein
LSKLGWYNANSKGQLVKSRNVLQRKCSKMTAEHTSIYGKVGAVWVDTKLNDAAKAMLFARPCAGEHEPMF